MGGVIYRLVVRREEEDKYPLIIDVQQAIADKAWTTFLESQTWWARLFLKRSDFFVDVPMNYYDFKNNSQTAGQDRNRKAEEISQTSSEYVNFETDFRNNTLETQTHDLKFETTRKFTVSVNYQRGFTFGGQTNFTVGLPKVLPGGQISREFSREVTVTKTERETFEKTITTAATSDIKVAPRSHYVASVITEECVFHVPFTVWVNMTMPAKQAKAYVRDKKNGETVFYYTISNLKDIFEKYPDTEIKEDDPKNPGAKERIPRVDAVQFKVEGILKGYQMSSAKIDLDSQNIRSSQDEKQSN